MKPVTRNAILDLMAITPNTPDNQDILSALDQLAGSLSVVEEPFSYTNTLAVAGAANALAAATTAPAVFTAIDASAMFIIESQTYDANTANAARTDATRVYPNVTVLISDSGTSKQWMDNPVPIPSIFGIGAEPFFLPKARIVPANSQISVVYTNFDAAAGYNIRLSFNGYRLYSLGGRSNSGVFG